MVLPLPKIKRMAYWIWRGLPPGADLDDITSEAVLGALQAREGCEVVAARRAIIGYLRRCNPGSRGARRLCLSTVWWLPSGEARQDRLMLDDELRGRLTRAVETLTKQELSVLRACFWDERSPGDAAVALGMKVERLYCVKSRAIRYLREQLA